MRTVAISVSLFTGKSGCAVGSRVAVVADGGDAAFRAAQRAARTRSQGELARSIGLAVETDQIAEHAAVAEQHRERTIGHQRACEADDWAEHACLRAVRRGRAARQIFEQAAVAR